MNDKEFTKYIANRPSAKESDGAWKRFVESNKLAEKETPKQTWERLEKEQQHPQDKYFDDKMKEIDKKGTSYLAKHLRKDPPIMERRGQQSLALNKIGKKVLDEGSLKPEDVELKLNENGLHTNKDRTIAVRDSFVANAFNKALKGNFKHSFLDIFFFWNNLLKTNHLLGNFKFSFSKKFSAIFINFFKVFIDLFVEI